MQYTGVGDNSHKYNFLVNSLNYTRDDIPGLNTKLSKATANSKSNISLGTPYTLLQKIIEIMGLSDELPNGDKIQATHQG